jgi:iron complex transport system substrate-binding protein
VKPPRVISLLPSATEIVSALGGEELLVGRSHECDWPPSVAHLPVCTSTRINADASSREIDGQVKQFLAAALSLYEVQLAKLRELRPDLILTQAQCEVCAVSVPDLERALADWTGTRPRILSLSPQRLTDIWEDHRRVAEALGLLERGREAIRRLKSRVVSVIERTCLMKRRPSVACLEWLDPLMAAGNWVPELVELAGGLNLFGEAGKHSPWLNHETLREHDPEFIVVMPCGFNVARSRGEIAALSSRAGWANLRAVKQGRVYLADGNQFFNRPGPRIVESLEILAEMLHPDLFRFGHRGRAWQPL